jgi:hypothetical protein
MASRSSLWEAAQRQLGFLHALAAVTVSLRETASPEAAALNALLGCALALQVEIADRAG